METNEQYGSVMVDEPILVQQNVVTTPEVVVSGGKLYCFF